MFLTAEEFTNELKLYNYYLEQLQKQTEILSTYYHDLYKKIKSPLDFDRLLGEKGEEIRLIKGRNSISEIQKIEMRDSLQEKYDKQFDICLHYKRKLKELDKQLETFDEKTRNICVAIYLDGKTYEQVGNEYHMATMTAYRELKRRLARYFEYPPRGN